MATTFEVITGGDKNRDESVPQGAVSQQAAEQQGQPDAVVESAGSVEESSQSAGGSGASGEGGGMSYADLYKALNPYRPKSEEEMNREKRKHRREAIIAAIGDGLSALSNLYFTTHYAPNMYDGKSTSSERVRGRYDKLLREQKEANDKYWNGLFAAMKADDARDAGARNWQRQLEAWAYKQQRDKAADEYKREKDRKADDRYNDAQEYKRERDKAADDRRDRDFNERKRVNDRNFNFRVQQQNKKEEEQKRRYEEARAKGVRGKRLGFSDGSGKNEVSIYESVWKGSMQEVYDVLAEDMRAAYDSDKSNNPRVPHHKTAAEKEDFVKQNWHRSSRARSIMLALSKLDPMTMTSRTSVDEDVINYSPSGDNVIDYVPGKK